jgi:hypothetical protein
MESEVLFVAEEFIDGEVEYVEEVKMNGSTGGAKKCQKRGRIRSKL